MRSSSLLDYIRRQYYPAIRTVNEKIYNVDEIFYLELIFLVLEVSANWGDWKNFDAAQSIYNLGRFPA